MIIIADFSAMIIFMRSVHWKDGLCGKNVIMGYDYKYNRQMQVRVYSKDKTNKFK